MIIVAIFFILVVWVASVSFGVGRNYGEARERRRMGILEHHEREAQNQKDAPFEVPLDDARGGKE